MFELDEFGNLVFVPRGLCFVDGEEGADGGGGGDTQAGGEDTAGGGGQDTVAAGAGQDTQAGGGDTLQGGESDDWRTTIEDAKARDYAKQFNSPAEAAQAAFRARQQLSNAIVRPGKDASEEDVATFHRALGIPEKAEDYKVALPDDLPAHMKPGSDQAFDDYKAFAHENNFSQEQFDANLNWYFSTVAKNEATLAEGLDKKQAESRQALEREWGRDFGANTEMAVRAATQLGGGNFLNFVETVEIDGVRLGDHPEFLRPFAKMGRLMIEDNPLMGVSEEEAKSLGDEHFELSGKILEARDRGDTAEVRRLSQQRDALNARLGSESPMVGTQGRTL